MKKIVLPRKRIIDLLESIFHYPLTILEAPMGFGKSTAVKEFLLNSSCRSLWITCMDANASTNHFWEQFANGVGKWDAKASDKLAHLGFPTDAPGIARFMDVFEEIEFDERTVIVIDDIHLLSDIRVANLLLQLTEEQTDNFHLVMVTRDTTHIHFTRLLSMGLCNVISQHRLKFNAEEIAAYCKLTYGDIPEQDLQQICTYTDGWVSLIYIILLGIKNGVSIGMNQTIDTLIEQALFNTYDQRIREFLLRVAIMDEFEGKQAQVVTQEEDAEDLLKRLVKENAFVQYDDQRRVYRIHNVLLDFLRGKQRFTEEELKSLYVRLGDWYLSRKEYGMGYAYLCKAGEVIRILELLSNPANIRNELSEFPGSFAMFDALPENLLMEYPLAYLQHIMVSIVRGNESIIGDCEERLQRLIGAYSKMEGITEAHRSRIMAEAMIMIRFTQFNHMEPSGDINRTIIRLLDGRQSYIMQRDNEVTFGSPSMLYIYFRDSGSFKHIMELLSERYPTYASFANGCGSGGDLVAQAEYALEIGDTKHAILTAQKAIIKAKMYDQTSLEICANFLLIRLAIVSGDIDGALSQLRDLEKSVSEISNPILDTSVEICKGYIYACLGQVERIPYWLQTGGMTDADMFIQGLAYSHIVYGKAVMLSGKYLELEMLTESFHKQFSIFSNQLGFIHNGIFLAVAKKHLYGLKSGVDVLSETLSMARCDDLVMPFIENAPFITDLMKTILMVHPNDPYLTRIFKGCENYNKALQKKNSDKVTLSNKEKEVLTLVAEGLSREAIAKQLVISQGTVKTHLQNIYTKLDVNGRVSAIKVAKMHGLI